MRPRPYLSWSQLNVLETSEKMYLDIYTGGREISNPGMELGREIHESLETGKDTGDIVKDIVIAKFPKLDIREYEIRSVVRIGNEEIPILSKIDTITRDMSLFYDYKTGSTKWNQKKADEYGQLTFYCVAVQSMAGIIPKGMELIWAPTEYHNGEPRLTGKIIRFKTKRSTADILKMKARMIRAWKRIEELTEGELL